MADARTLFVVCLLFLHLEVISAARVSNVRNFEVEMESEQGAQLKQTRQSIQTGDTTIQQVNASSTDATGLYKLSYEDYGATWQQFKLDHKRVYKSASEERQRFAIFMDNVKQIERHNWQFHNGLTTYWMGINQFSDWTDEDWRSILVPIVINATTDSQAPPPRMNVGVPYAIDWRSKGYVTGVKNQTGSLEGQWFRNRGQLISLSEQQLVDCSGSVGNQGCKGGWVDRSFSYIRANWGIAGQTDYPYTAKVSDAVGCFGQSPRHKHKCTRLSNGAEVSIMRHFSAGVFHNQSRNEGPGPCRYRPGSARATVTGYIDVNPSGNEWVLMNAVATVGPVSVYFYVSGNFRSYMGGIFTDSTCNFPINHAVLVVGYGTSGGQDYWLVKNSWGTGWGEQGYIRVARNSGNMCRIASYAYYPIV